MANLHDDVDRIFRQESPATIALTVLDLADGNVLSERNGDLELSTASVGKLFALIELAVRIDDGREQAGTLLQRTAADAASDSGIWQHLQVDTLSAHDVATLVGCVSDNLAANVLVRHLSLSEIERRAAALGMICTGLHDRVRDHRSPEDPPHLSTGSTSDLAGLMRWLTTDEQQHPDGVGQRVLGWLDPGADLSMVASAFGLDPLSHVSRDRGIRLCNKTGTDRGVRADVGIVDGPAGGVAYATICNWDESTDVHDLSRDAVLKVMRSIGAALRSHVTEA